MRARPWPSGQGAGLKSRTHRGTRVRFPPGVLAAPADDTLAHRYVSDRRSRPPEGEYSGIGRPKARSDGLVAGGIWRPKRHVIPMVQYSRVRFPRESLRLRDKPHLRPETSGYGMQSTDCDTSMRRLKSHNKTSEPVAQKAEHVETATSMAECYVSSSYD